MYWVDDFKSKYYNQLVDITRVEKDWTSAEHLIDYPIQYEYLIEIKTNPQNIAKKGSAIFLHCSNNEPTAGCVAINSMDMKKIVENIDKNTKIKIYEG
jgi:L,D-peptidoglycan transpeptidase YkuD (ErfK/YbiS/YcfS/YnhG family)